MEKDGVYRPDRTIRDVYEDGTEAHQYDQLGLSPYARIGSLADESQTSDKSFKRPSRPKLNYHAFTFVGPLTGDTLSPEDRMSLSAQAVDQHSGMLAAKRLPSLIIAAIAYINKTKQLGEEVLAASERSLESDKYLSISNTIPVFVSFIAVLLLVYAAVISPQGTIPNPNGGGGQSIGGSSFNNPNIIDNRALFPLAIFPNGNSSSKSSSNKNNSSNEAATQYKYVSPTNAQPTGTLNTTVYSGGLGGGGATGVQSPSTSNVQQTTSSTQLSQPLSGTSGTSGSTITSPTSGSTATVPTSTSSSGGTSTSIPGVTSPTSVTSPSTSVTSPVTNKSVISTSPTTITLN